MFAHNINHGVSVPMNATLEEKEKIYLEEIEKHPIRSPGIRRG